MRKMKNTITAWGMVLMVAIRLSLPAWWDAGHMVVASIAYQRMTPYARTQADALVPLLSRDYPYTNHFLALSTWPDDLKGEGVHAYDAWHYTNIPYNPDRLNIPKSPDINVVWAINNCQSVLTRDRTRPVEKARALAFLIHCVGDIHQPLHCGSMYSDECPGGDLGGNKFDIEDSHRHLHQLWDDGCGLTSDLNDINPYGQPREGLTEAEVKRVGDFAKILMQAFPAKDFSDLNQLDPDFWALEGHKLAVKYGYHGRNGMAGTRPAYLQPGGTPGEEYLKTGREVAGSQLARAGYRLANMLNEIWSE